MIVQLEVCDFYFQEALRAMGAEMGFQVSGGCNKGQVAVMTSAGKKSISNPEHGQGQLAYLLCAQQWEIGCAEGRGEPPKGWSQAGEALEHTTVCVKAALTGGLSCQVQCQDTWQPFLRQHHGLHLAKQAGLASQPDVPFPSGAQPSQERLLGLGSLGTSKQIYRTENLQWFLRPSVTCLATRPLSLCDILSSRVQLSLMLFP